MIILSSKVYIPLFGYLKSDFGLSENIHLIPNEIYRWLFFVYERRRICQSMYTYYVNLAIFFKIIFFNGLRVTIYGYNIIAHISQPIKVPY